MDYLHSNSKIYEYPIMRILIFLFFIFPFSLFSQNKDYKRLDKALISFELNDFDKSKKILLKILSNNPNWDKPNLLLADIYINELDFYSAENYLLKVFDISSVDDINGINQIAMIFFENAYYNDALKYFNIICSLDQFYCEKNIGNLVECCNFSIQAINNPVNFTPINLGPNINSDLSENGPAITSNGDMILFTRRVLNKQNHPQEDFYFSIKKNDIWENSKAFPYPLNTPFNEGALSFSSDKSKIIFTACNRDDSFGSCDLYWGNSNSMNFSNCGDYLNTKFWESQACFSPDGNYLYFVSNRPGGYGGTDIWISQIINGEFSLPINAGEIINTSKDEMSPFLHSDNKTLYFASSGHVGMGKYDIYVSRRFNSSSKWEPVLNLGFPINNHLDQNSLVVSSDGETAFFSSDFKGYGMEDIFSFQLSESYQANNLSDLELQIISTEKGAEIILDDINFINNSYQLDSNSFIMLDYLVNYLIDNKFVNINIEGHTDNIGSPNTNKILSINRAKSVYEYLIYNNIPYKQLSYTGYGLDKPIFNNLTKEGRSKNRRTSFTVQ